MKTAKQKLITDSVLGSIALVLVLCVISTLTYADKPVNTPPFGNGGNSNTTVCPTVNPVQVIQQPVSVTLLQCDAYQIRVITTRGNNSIDSETLGYCDLEQAQNVLAQLNASAYRKLPKGQPVYQIAYPLF